MDLDGIVTGPSGVVSGFDDGYPGGLDWKACDGVEVAYEGANAGEVVGVEGSRVHRSSGMDWWMCVDMIFEAEREAP